MPPSISVIIPAYNRANLLRLVIESVLSQTQPVEEILVIDDGSRDNTAEMVQQSISTKPAWRGRVRYHYQENQGQSAALNNGIARAKGEWLGFTAQDDLWLPWKLEWQVRALQQHPECGLCFTDAWFMNNPYMKKPLFEFAQSKLDGAVGVIESPAEMIVGRHPIWTQTVIARADIVRRIEGFDSFLRYSEDHDFLFRMGLQTKFCYVGIPLVLIDRSPADERHVGEGENWHREEFCLRMDQHRFEKQLELSVALPAGTQKAARRSLRNLHSAWANWHLDRGDYPQALRSMQTAISYEATPSLLLKWLLARATPGAVAGLLRRDRAKLVRYDRVSWKHTKERDPQPDSSLAESVANREV
jgi:hypothetical protein